MISLLISWVFNCFDIQFSKYLLLNCFIRIMVLIRFLDIAVQTPVVHNFLTFSRYSEVHLAPGWAFIQKFSYKNLVEHIISFFAFHIFSYLVFLIPIQICCCMCLLLSCVPLPSPFCFPSYLSSFTPLSF